LVGGDGREWRDRVEDPIRPGGGSLRRRWGVGYGGSCRCPNLIGQSFGGGSGRCPNPTRRKARVDIPIRPANFE